MGSMDTMRRPEDEGEGDDELLVGATSSGPRSIGSRGRRRRWTWRLRPWIAAERGRGGVVVHVEEEGAGVGAPTAKESFDSPWP